MKVGRMLGRLSVDIVRPLTDTPRSNRFILVDTCPITKWVEIFALPGQTAATCARTFMNDVFAIYMEYVICFKVEILKVLYSKTF